MRHIIALEIFFIFMVMVHDMKKKENRDYFEGMARRAAAQSKP